jgi:hypothetical protein
MSYNHYGLGKQRTKLGKYLDQRKIKQNDIIRLTGFNRELMKHLCSSGEHKPQKDTKRRIIGALHRLGFDDVTESDLW